MIDLTTLSQATAQEVFDQAKNHLLTQNEKSVRVDTPLCLYRSEKIKNGNVKILRCGGGCFITDEQYKPEIEAHGWGQLGEVLPEWTDAHCELIRDIQFVHDTMTSRTDLEQKLRNLAETYGLQYGE